MAKPALPKTPRPRAAAPLPDPVRNFAPRGIAALIAPVLRPALRRRGAALATLIEDWPTIVGADLAARCQPVKSAAGTLTIGCAGPDALELQHMAPALLGRINLALGGFPIERLRFTDLPPSALPAPARRRLRSEPPPDTNSLPEGPLGEAFARLRKGIYNAKQ